MDAPLLTGAEPRAHDIELAQACNRALREQIKELKRERTMLASRCAAQAHEIARLLQPLNVDTLIERIRVKADEDGALHFDALRSILAGGR